MKLVSSKMAELEMALAHLLETDMSEWAFDARVEVKRAARRTLKRFLGELRNDLNQRTESVPTMFDDPREPTATRKD